MTTLGQIVGIHKGTKTDAQRSFDQIYKTLQKGDLFIGLSKVHTAFEGTLQQPAQEKLVQANAIELLQKMEQILTRAIDVEATKDYADTNARADIIVDGEPLLTGVPVTHLLWLEKQFSNFVTVFRALPVQSAAESWMSAANLPLGVYRTPEEKAPSTKKVTEFQIVVPASANGNHPADVREVSKDIQSGEYTTVKFTAAFTSQGKEILVQRATELLNATKQAIVAANHTEITNVSEGSTIFSYLFDNVV